MPSPAAPLINQLKAGGRMVIPVGLPDAQQLVPCGKGHQRQSHDQGNYAGTILAARGARSARIPAILIKWLRDSSDEN
jgi:protein-L-isoaspartate O-methyltransferase